MFQVEAWNNIRTTYTTASIFCVHGWGRVPKLILENIGCSWTQFPTLRYLCCSGNEGSKEVRQDIYGLSQSVEGRWNRGSYAVKQHTQFSFFVQFGMMVERIIWPWHFLKIPKITPEMDRVRRSMNGMWCEVHSAEYGANDATIAACCPPEVCVGMQLEVPASLHPGFRESCGILHNLARFCIQGLQP